jgi:hypothetical protein
MENQKSTFSSWDFTRNTLNNYYSDTISAGESIQNSFVQNDSLILTISTNNKSKSKIRTFNLKTQKAKTYLISENYNKIGYSIDDKLKLSDTYWEKQGKFAYLNLTSDSIISRKYYPFKGKHFGGINKHEFSDCNKSYSVFSDAYNYNLRLLDDSFNLLDDTLLQKKEWKQIIESDFFTEKFANNMDEWKTSFSFYQKISLIKDIQFLDSNKFAVIELRPQGQFYLDLWKIENNKLIIVKQDIPFPQNRGLQDEESMITKNHLPLTLTGPYYLDSKYFVATEVVSLKENRFKEGITTKQSHDILNHSQERINSKDFGVWIGVFEHNLMDYYE